MKPFSALAPFALSLAVLTMAACKGKETEPQTVPLPSSSAVAAVTADPTPTGSAAPAESAAPAASADLAPPPPDTAAPKPTGGGSIDACCSALDAIAKSGKDAISKNRAASAAAVCKGLSKAVKDGSANRARSLTTIRAQLQGTDIPGACR